MQLNGEKQPKGGPRDNQRLINQSNLKGKNFLQDKNALGEEMIMLVYKLKSSSTNEINFTSHMRRKSGYKFKSLFLKSLLK